ncbi:DUF2771 domain-containing protein [Antrihabitans cavernicola]|uniref:DUF2771 domain-containing protein n=1 Tax=Antrihabitans cavernicola TaxID=2495913 RepID=UPI0016593C3F|nr:DUF2771 domain-containing protein [Spelaeibacter cavernicola]
MKLQPKTVKILAGLGALVLVVVIGLVAVLYVAIRDKGPKQPSVIAYSHGKSIDVKPLEYCSVTLQDCTQGPIAQLEVPGTDPLQLSLPDDISAAPWRLVMIFEKPDGTLVPQERYFKKDEVAAVTVQSEESPKLRLNGVEIQLPSAVVDENGLPKAHAIWSIKTRG